MAGARHNANKRLNAAQRLQMTHHGLTATASLSWAGKNKRLVLSFDTGVHQGGVILTATLP